MAKPNQPLEADDMIKMRLGDLCSFAALCVAVGATEPECKLEQVILKRAAQEVSEMIEKGVVTILSGVPRPYAQSVMPIQKQKKEKDQ